MAFQFVFSYQITESCILSKTWFRFCLFVCVFIYFIMLNQCASGAQGLI